MELQNDRMPVYSVEELRQIKRKHRATEIKSHLKALQPLNYIALIVFVLIIGAIGIYIYLTVENAAFPFMSLRATQNDFGIVIDAGSHGSRLHLFSWPSRIHDPEHPLSGPVTYPEEIAAFSTSPGITAFAKSEPALTGPHTLGPLIDKVKQFLKSKKIREAEWSSIPIFLKATAGMRNLDALTRARIMKSIRLYLSDSKTTPFAFQWDWARIIAGEEEGVYGWLTVNKALSKIMMPASSTVGALDMGGASMQITFSPVHTSVLEDYYGLILGGKTIRLYSHSYLGYGWGDSLARLSTKLAVMKIVRSMEKKNLEIKEINKNNDTSFVNNIKSISIPHPCYPKGHTYNFDMPSLVYPEGRFFVDVDRQPLLKYMRSLKIPDNYLIKLFPRLRDSKLNNNNNTSDIYDQQYKQIINLSNHEEVPFEPLDVPLPLNAAPQTKWRIKFKGSSDFEKCQKLAKELFYNLPCFIHSCSFNGVYQPRLENSKFVAVGQYSKVQKALNISITPTLKDMEIATENVCNLSRKELKKARKMNSMIYTPMSRKGLMKLCWKAVWAHTALTWGFGFNIQNKNIDFAQNNSTGPQLQSVGWAAGSMLYEVNNFPWKTSAGKFELAFFWALISIILMFIMILLQLTKLRQYSKILSLAGISQQQTNIQRPVLTQRLLTDNDDCLEENDVS